MFANWTNKIPFFRQELGLFVKTFKLLSGLPGVYPDFRQMGIWPIWLLKSGQVRFQTLTICTISIKLSVWNLEKFGLMTSGFGTSIVRCFFFNFQLEFEEGEWNIFTKFGHTDYRFSPVNWWRCRMVSGFLKEANILWGEFTHRVALQHHRYYFHNFLVLKEKNYSYVWVFKFDSWS